MNREEEDDVPIDPEEILKKLERMIEELESLSLQQQAADPKRHKLVDSLITEARDAVEEVVSWQRERDDEAQLASVLGAIDRNTATFLKAIVANTATANELLAVSSARLSQIEEELTEQGQPAFEVDPKILAEAVFLKAQLAGVEGTEGPGPLFKDALAIQLPSGLEVLAEAVTTNGAVYPTP